MGAGSSSKRRAGRRRAVRMSVLTDLVDQNDLARIKSLLAQPEVLKAASTQTSEDGLSLLHYIVACGSQEMLRAVVRAGVPVDTVDALTSSTALHAAVEAGRGDFVTTLLRLRANANARNADGRTPLHLLPGSPCSSEVLGVLRYHGGSLSEADNDGYLVQHWVVTYARLACLRSILPDIDINAQHSFGWTMATMAASAGLTDVLRVLIKADADLSIRDAEGCTALHHAASNGRTECVREICRSIIKGGGGNTKDLLNIADRRQRTPLHVAARQGHMQEVKMLVKTGARLELVNDTGRTATEEAAVSHHLRVATYLDKAGCTGRVGKAPTGRRDSRLAAASGAGVQSSDSIRSA